MNVSARSVSAQSSTSYSAPRVWLGLEGATLLLGSTAAYFVLGGHWLLFVSLLLVPDIAMLGYLFGKRSGAHIYNFFHSTPLPAALLTFGFFAAQPLAVSVAFIWFAHIGLDRMIGYGLKYGSGFKDTHLNRV